MLNHRLIPSIAKKVSSYSLALEREPLIALKLKYKIFIKVFQYILKSLKTLLIRNISMKIPKKTNKTKNPGRILI